MVNKDLKEDEVNQEVMVQLDYQEVLVSKGQLAFLVYQVPLEKEESVVQMEVEESVESKDQMEERVNLDNEVYQDLLDLEVKQAPMGRLEGKESRDQQEGLDHQVNKDDKENRERLVQLVQLANQDHVDHKVDQDKTDVKVLVANLALMVPLVNQVNKDHEVPPELMGQQAVLDEMVRGERMVLLEKLVLQVNPADVVGQEMMDNVVLQAAEVSLG